LQDSQQKALNDQQEQFAEEVGKQIGRLRGEYDAKVLAVGQELNEQLAAAVLEKEVLEARVKALAEQLTLAERALADLEKQHDEQLTVLKQRHKQQLEDLEGRHERRVTEVETRRAGEVAELRKLIDQLGKMEQETSTRLRQVQAKNDALESELNTCRNSSVTLDSDMEKERKDELGRLDAEKSHIKQQLEAAEERLRKLESDKSVAMKTKKELRERLESKVAELQKNLEESRAGND